MRAKELRETLSDRSRVGTTQRVGASSAYVHSTTSDMGRTGPSQTWAGHPRSETTRASSVPRLTAIQFPELSCASYNKNPAALNEPDGIVAVWNLHLLERPEFVFHSQVCGSFRLPEDAVN